MSVTKITTNINTIKIDNELKEMYIMLKQLADEINNMEDKIFGTIHFKDLICKNLQEFATLKATRKAIFENELNKARTLHESIFNLTKSSLIKKTKK